MQYVKLIVSMYVKVTFKLEHRLGPVNMNNHELDVIGMIIRPTVDSLVLGKMFVTRSILQV